MVRLGFIGTGTITRAIVEGLNHDKQMRYPIVVSPRNEEHASYLAGAFKNVRIAASNQQVADESEILFLALRPQVAEQVVRQLRFRKNQKLVSFMAAISAETLASWTSQPVRITQAIPLPFVAARLGATVIYPPDETVAAIFGELGRAIEVRNPESLLLFFAASALMGTYFGVLETAWSWLRNKGLDEVAARDYLDQLFAGLSHASGSGGAYSELREEFSTKGGLNEQLYRVFREAGGVAAVESGLRSVWTRLNEN
ncbi:pyrroline-5-carboxylate reductase [Ensifer aridi]|uniref:pyrroline-5-carboxylate reductase n=1 Tax=Ensifer aridi TaxID=1708715 RepID=UPI000409DE6F|nr:pyrroline-5-carboxylate reductase [Ensifer aridi]